MQQPPFIHSLMTVFVIPLVYIARAPRELYAITIMQCRVGIMQKYAGRNLKGDMHM